ncbi:MAG TPA: ABC transporter ATP-binding protein [Candidatus Avamphibacillus sp.]|nr:ABC transporter ATP-binding protein [Candidatus Avamphibacillus sp.]
MLKVKEISKSFGKNNVLNQLSFSTQPGEIIGLVGENGAGKSTLLKILATIEKQDQGCITFDGVPYEGNIKDIRKKIGFVPQDIAIWENFSVEENMVFFEKLGWKNKNKSALRALCLDMKLDKWKEKASTLSGGMKRKLNLAITLIHEPTLLLLDEPTVGIDLKSKKEIGYYLKQLANQEKKTIIYTSHDMDEIIHLCNRVLCIGNDPFYEDILKKSNKQLVTFN